MRVTTARIRVVIADSSDEVCHALTRLLGRAADIEVVGVAQSEASALEAMHSERPDVLLIDYSLCRSVVTSPGQDGGSPQTQALVLVVHPSDGVVLRDVAWMLKDATGEELRRRIREVAKRVAAAEDAS